MPVSRPARVLLLAALATGAISCLKGDTSAPLDSQLRVINVSNAILTVAADDHLVLDNAEPGNVSALFMQSGQHTIKFLDEAGNTAVISVTATPNGVQDAYVYSVNNSLAAVLLDTGSTVPAGKSKLRVVHLSKLAGNVDIWRTQPDAPTPTKVQTPFPYLTTSPFVQSDSGKWEVFTTAVGGAATVLTTGTFSIPSGGRRTVVLMDVSGAATFRILPE